MEGERKQNLKRKRPEIPKEDLGTRISGKLHHELHQVYHACKKAKTFETQKLVKRLKQLRGKGKDRTSMQDHEAQLNFIKAIDHNRLGNAAFKSKLLKDKMLRENQLVQDALTEEIDANNFEPLAPGTPQSKVHNRLLSSKIIASQVSASLGTLKAILNPDAPSAKRARSEMSKAVDTASKPKKETLTSLAKKEVHPSASESETDDEVNGEGAGWESGTVDGNESEERSDENSWESGSTGRSDEDEDGDKTSPGKVPPKKPTKAAAATPGPSSLKAKVESTFLPSLSVGYIHGSDDSDVDDGDGGKVMDLRKNRRGQRARRAIWEKKYGQNANHMKKEIIRQTERTWTNMPSRAPPSCPGYSTHRPPLKVKQGGFRAPQRSHNNNSHKSIHPSWEAKRKMKEKQSDAIVPSQGKKIKF